MLQVNSGADHHWCEASFSADNCKYTIYTSSLILVAGEGEVTRLWPNKMNSREQTWSYEENERSSGNIGKTEHFSTVGKNTHELGGSSSDDEEYFICYDNFTKILDTRWKNGKH